MSSTLTYAMEHALAMVASVSLWVWLHLEGPVTAPTVAGATKIPVGPLYGG